MAQLSVELTANIQSLENGLKKAQKDLKTTGDVAEREGKKIRNVGKGTGGGKPFEELKKGAANATPTLQEFSRVIQDAPFGIQGVANNITQLVSNFGNLSRAAGGTKAALSSLLGAFAGPAGLLFVVSLVTSLMVSFGDTTKKTEKKLDDLRKKLDEGKRAFENFKRAEEAAIKGSELSERSTITQRTNLIALIEDQKILVRAKLTEIKAQLATLEAIRLQQTAVQGLADLWDKGVGNVVSTIKRDVSFVVSALFAALAANKAFTDASDFLVGSAEKRTKATEEEKGLVQIINDLTAELAGLNTDILQIQKDINDELKEQIKLRKEINTLLRIGRNFSTVFSPSNIAAQGGQQAADIAGDFLTNFRAIGEQSGQNLVNGLSDGIGSVANGLKEQLFKLVDLVVKGVEAIETAATKIVDRFKINVLLGFGEAIGAALANGDNVLKAAGASLLSSMGQLLMELGGLAIAAGVGIEKVKTALLTLNGGIAIAAGVALVAVGAAFKAGAAKLAQSARGASNGGVSGQGSQSFSGSASFSSGFSDGGTVVFEIAGTKLVGVLNRTLKQNRRSLADVL